MPKQPLISVIVPAYNTAGTILDSLDSVFAQTFKGYEVIVVDDGSPDNVNDVVKKAYGSKVKLISQPNQGLAGARNTGIKQAAGRYIAFLDSDDAWLPDKLAEQVKQIEEHPEADVLYTNCYFWDGKKTLGEWTDVHQQKNGQIARELISREVMLPVLTTLVKADALQRAGMFDASLRQVEDYDLWLRLALKGANFLAHAAPLAYYRLNPQGLSSNRLLMARTQAGIYKRLAISAPQDYRGELSRQYQVFAAEVLHQKRLNALKSRRYLAASWLTLAMIRHNPAKALKLVLTAAGIALHYPALIKRLSSD